MYQRFFLTFLQYHLFIRWQPCSSILHLNRETAIAGPLYPERHRIGPVHYCVVRLIGVSDRNTHRSIVYCPGS